MTYRLQTDIEISTLSDADKESRIRHFESVQSKSDLSRNMQELLGVYLLFERLVLRFRDPTAMIALNVQLQLADISWKKAY